MRISSVCAVLATVVAAVRATEPSISTTDENGLLLAAEGPILMGKIDVNGRVATQELVPKADLDAALAQITLQDERLSALEPLSGQVNDLSKALRKAETVLETFGVRFNETDDSFTDAQSAAQEFQESVGDFIDDQLKVTLPSYVTKDSADTNYAPKATVQASFTQISERLQQLQDLVEKSSDEKLPRCPAPDAGDNGKTESNHKNPGNNHPDVPFVPGIVVETTCGPGYGIKGATFGSDERSYERVCYSDGTWASVADKRKFTEDATCEKCEGKPYSTVDVTKFYRNTQGARWGRDFRSGNPGETSTWTVGPLDLAGFQGIKFEYEYVFGYSGNCGWTKGGTFKDCSGVPDRDFPEMKVFVTNGEQGNEDARVQFYSSGHLRNYPYDNCNQNGGWGDSATKNDGCYSPAVVVDANRDSDTGAWSFNEKAEGKPGPQEATTRDIEYDAPGDAGAWLKDATTINIVFEFNNNRKNMHLNPHHMDMQLAGALFDKVNRACKKD